MMSAEFFLSFLVALPFYLVIKSWRKKLAMYSLPYAVILAVSYISLISFGWFFDPFIPIVAVSAHGIFEQVHKWRAAAKGHLANPVPSLGG
jgi:CHASE2 domain-containing sensor protein